MASWLVEAAACNHRGILRPNNEDNYYLNGRWLTLEGMAEGGCESARCDAPFQLYAVCDGLGGEAQGERASFEAVRTLGELQARHAAGLAEPELLEALKALSQRIGSMADAEDERVGTTLAACLWQNGQVRVLNIGDSRVYRLRTGRLTRLTHDHSEVQRLVDRGYLTDEQARKSPRRHIILQYVGMPPQDAAYRPDLSHTMPARSGDVYLICTDGLPDMVGDSAIRTLLLRAHTSAAAAADALVRRALDNGGRDNVTVLCACVRRTDGSRIRRLLNGIAAAFRKAVIRLPGFGGGQGKQQA